MLEVKKKELSVNDLMNQAECIIATCEPVEMPLTHRFTDNMYIREIFMPAGTILTSKIHKTNHPFVVSKGKCIVYDGNKLETITAPHTGVTKPNTRRLLYIEEDTIWTTFHVTDKTDVDEIEKDIIQEHNNEILDKELFNKFNKINTQNNIFINKKEALQ